MQAFHRKVAADCFNQCWTFIEKQERSPEDVEDMLMLAYTSMWHWKQREDVTPTSLSIGYWQLSRVHALGGQYDLARAFGERCLKLGLDNHLPPFYVGYAYEALARAEALHGNAHRASDHLAGAKAQLARVVDKEEADLLRPDLAGLESMLAEPPTGQERK